MADATAGFFDALARRGHEPLLGDVVGSVRFELVSDSQIDIWRVALDHGRRLGVARRPAPPTASCAPTSSCSTASPPARSMPWPLCCAERWPSRATRSCWSACSGSSRHPPLPGSPRAERTGDERRSGQDPGRQHVRGQRSPGRHRGVADRSDRPVLVRHPLSLAVGADGRWPASESAFGRRSALLRRALLPRSGNGNRLCRRKAVADPSACGRRRLPRAADDLQPRSRAGRRDRTDRGGVRLRGPVRGQGRAREERELQHPDRGRQARAFLPARDVHARDGDLREPFGRPRRGRAHVLRAARAAR